MDFTHFPKERKVNGHPKWPVSESSNHFEHLNNRMGCNLSEHEYKGMWTRQEAVSQINILTLKATFAAHLCNCHILLLIDNTTAVATTREFQGVVKHNNWYVGMVLGKGSVDTRTTHSMMWECLWRHIVQTVYLSNWFLNRTIFKPREDKWRLFSVNLFVAHHNQQLKFYFSFCPVPQAERIRRCLSWSHQT